MRVAWSPEADAEARAIAQRLADVSPAKAEHVRLALSLAAERLSDFPRLGKAMGSDRIRLLNLARTPLRILYRIDGERITIIGVVWGG